MDMTFFELIESGFPFSRLLDSFAKENDLETMPAGRYALADGAYASIQEYMTHENVQFEAHKKWIDIQMIVSGSERILTAPIEAGKAITDYDAEKDICLYTCSEQIRAVDLNAGRLAVLFPKDLHAPGNSSADSVLVRKLIFKIPVKRWSEQEAPV